MFRCAKPFGQALRPGPVLPLRGVPSAPNTLLVMTRSNRPGVLASCPAYAFSCMAKAAGCIVNREPGTGCIEGLHGAAPHTRKPWCAEVTT